MKKEQFSAEELQQLEEVRVLGGGTPLPQQHPACANVSCLHAECTNGACLQPYCSGTNSCAQSACTIHPPYSETQCACNPYVGCPSNTSCFG